MFGDNDDIPAFRWYDKDQHKLLVSGKDAAELNARYAKGQGLLRGGSSIDNMLAGDAEKSLLTVADITSGDKEQAEAPGRGHPPADAQPLLLHAHARAVLRRRGAGGLGGPAAEAPERLAPAQPAARRLPVRPCRHDRARARSLGQSDHPGHRARLPVDLRHLARLRRGGPPLRPLDQGRLRRAGAIRPGHRPHTPGHQGKGPAALRPDHPLGPRPVVRADVQDALWRQPEGVHRAAVAHRHHSLGVDGRRHGHDLAGGPGRRAGQRPAAGRRRDGQRRGQAGPEADRQERQGGRTSRVGQSRPR